MEEKFIAAWAAAREKALALGIRMRPVAPEDALKTARYLLDHNRCSDGFDALAARGQLAEPGGPGHGQALHRPVHRRAGQYRPGAAAGRGVLSAKLNKP